jgi:hypothetical protein
MSFDALKAADVTPKKKEVKIKVGENTYKFTAKEIPYLQRLHLASIQQSGGDAFTQLIVYSIVDQDGKHMSVDQANGLSPEHAEAFFVAASEVNAQGQEEKN